MTKEEYEKLLKSDYWKGYSYSLIKERNFTCEDCGRSFYNERNKLQVHHLVYRDVNPWSYSPEELVVLCEECHKRRHGILTEPITDTTTSSEYVSSYSHDTTSRVERNSTYGYERSRDTNDFTNNIDSRFAWPEEHERHFKFKYVIYGLLAILALTFGYDRLHIQKQTAEKTEAKQQNDTEEEKIDAFDGFSQRSGMNRKSSKIIKDENGTPLISEGTPLQSDEVTDEPITTTIKSATRVSSNHSSEEDLSTIELLEKRNHEDVVEQAKRVGVSTEGSTLDILERINHADVVKQAKRAGVSTNGSTLDILERINHADAVKQAKRAGVSTEGSTLDILERINHADVVKQAKRVGVSTEGSTLEILERINRKSIESR